MTREERDKCICAAYVGGKTLHEVGREYGLATTVVWRILFNAGVKTRGTGRRRDPALVARDEQICDARRRGVSLGEIARGHGISLQRVHQILNRAVP